MCRPDTAAAATAAAAAPPPPPPGVTAESWEHVGNRLFGERAETLAAEGV